MVPDKVRQDNRSDILEPELLLAAYASGYFPMADSPHGNIRWYSPDPRAVIPLDGFTISRSLRQTIRKKIFDVKVDTAFEDVIRGCAARHETWISEEIVQSYLELHRRGFGHSVEVWRGMRLAGGLYGVALGAAFFGESMFSRERDASKVALVALVDRLRQRHFELLDTQYTTPHLAGLGVVEIPKAEYLGLLDNALRKQPPFVD